MVRKAKWSVATARQRLPKVISSAAREPQEIYRRNRLVATVVSPEFAEAVVESRRAVTRPSLADAWAELRQICAEERYTLPTPRRRDRNPGPRR